MERVILARATASLVLFFSTLVHGDDSARKILPYWIWTDGPIGESVEFDAPEGKSMRCTSTTSATAAKTYYHNTAYNRICLLAATPTIAY